MIIDKITDPLGHTLSVSYREESIELVRFLDRYRNFFTITPYFIEATIKQDYRHRKPLILRVTRAYGMPPQLHFKSLLVHIGYRLSEILDRTRDELDIYSYIKEIVKSCYKKEKPFISIYFPLNINECINRYNKNSLYSFYDKLFNKFYEDLINNNPRDTAFRFWDILYGNADEIKSMRRLYTMIIVFTYIRNFTFIINNDKMEYDLRPRIKELIKDKEISNELSLFNLFHGSYVGIINYALINWYSRIFGVKLPPAALRAYKITGFRASGKGSATPLIWMELRDYPEFEENDLLRYANRYDVDLSSFTAASDLFVEKVYYQPWIRAGAYTLLGRLVNYRGYYDNVVVIPLLYPKKSERGREPLLDSRVRHLPIPVQRRIELRTETARLLRSAIEFLLNDPSVGEPSETLSSTVTLVGEILDEEVSEYKEDFMRRIEKLSNTLDKDILLGIGYEVLHPIRDLVLYNEALTRIVAQQPSSIVNIYGIRTLMERLASTDYITINFYLIVNINSIYNNFWEEIEGFKRIFVAKPREMLESYNLERIASKLRKSNVYRDIGEQLIELLQ